MEPRTLHTPTLPPATGRPLLLVVYTLILLATRWLATPAAAAPTAREEALVAVASNFAEPAAELAKLFEAETTYTVTLTPGATGKHYTQIVNGAPFDLFLSADDERTAQLEKDGKVLPGTRFVYAVGRLALWSPKPGFVDPEGKILQTDSYTRLAIASPDLAPYGAAARQVLVKLGAWEKAEKRLVFGTNIAQAYQFVESGNAEMGFVAWSQLKRLPPDKRGSFWLVPAGMHDPIRQEAVLLRDTPPARAFLTFLRTPRARLLIASHGYDLPPAAGSTP